MTSRIASLHRFGRPPGSDAGLPSLDRLPLLERPRRNRKSDWARRLVREATLTPDDLIWPIFLTDGRNRRDPVGAMPGVERMTVDLAVLEAERAASLRIPVIALFPYTDPDRRDETGREALNAGNLVCSACRAIKAAVPEIGILTDVALDPYTSHGHDGLLRDGVVLNDETVAVLVRQALVQAEAGADIVAPSDMMDGRVGAIREGLERGRPDGRSDHGLYRQIRLRLLRPLSRGGRLGRHPQGRQADLPDGSGQQRRGDP
jgi:porphobilinogen synthase